MDCTRPGMSEQAQALTLGSEARVDPERGGARGLPSRGDSHPCVPLGPPSPLSCSLLAPSPPAQGLGLLSVRSVSRCEEPGFFCSEVRWTMGSTGPSKRSPS